MTVINKYDYSATAPFIEPFNKRVGDEPFIINMLELDNKLWQFKSLVESSIFGVNRSKDYIFLRHRVKDSGIFVNWNFQEVSLVEQHRDKYVVITLHALDRSDNEIKHMHSIVMHEDDDVGVFDLDHLVTHLHEGNNDELAKNFH